MPSPALPPQRSETILDEEDELLRARYEQFQKDFAAGRYWEITREGWVWHSGDDKLPPE